ncbi:hypothetical protein [Pseudobdellovibrio exovorus]|uniref:VWFA domain-containing protein n=1 Tax=Pseudobdellovibrio exovorus JSS TaxID=1184267 RepID=M4V6V6_9BACT|nr:hypothetical protein [Pseudobdellovibrio exovorus]AGH94933.1 hypothetical protein A11Q_713 [Pseudobdellovibrio exovorus JSS]
MKREQKMGIVGLSIIGLLVVSPMFQNCAKTNYDVFNNGLGGALGTSRKVTIDPTYNQVKANLKVLFVVDDSYTMTQSQQQLANAVDSLLTPLKGHNVDLKIVSTSGIPSNEVDYTIATKYLDESRNTVSQSQAQSLSSYLIERSISNKNVRHNNLKLFRNSTDSQFGILKTQIRDALLAVGTSGSDTEEGLCATARQLFDESSSRFFQAGDKAAIVILTDEDDSSNFASCMSRYIQRVSSQPVVYYSYGQQRARVSLEYQLSQDGVTKWMPVQWGVSLNGQNTITNGATCTQAHKDYAVNRITSQGYIVRNVTDCIYETVPVSYYGADLGDNGSNANLNLCSSQVTFNNVNYPNLYDLVHAVGLSASPSSCSKQVLPGNVASSAIEFDSVIKSDISASSAQNLISAIRNKSVELFGSSGFTVATLARFVGDSCALNAGQSYGTAYETLSVILGNNNSSTQSLCSGNFSNTLSQVSTFMASEAASSYVVPGLLSTEKVNSVVILRNGQRQILSLSDYEAVGATITLTNFTLQLGDVLEVEIGPI